MGKTKTTAELIELGIQTTIKLGELDISPLNVRKDADAKPDPELVASIESMGLLQPLIAYFDPKTGRGQVCGGGRRLRALKALLKQGKLTTDTEIPIRHMAQDDAIEASMAENLERRDMGLADEFEAFRSLITTGRYDADLIAKRFGYTVTYVQRRLRLAQLAPEILDAVSAGKVGIDGAMAYASLETPEEQLSIFKREEKNNWKPHSAENIKSIIRQKGMTVRSHVFAYAGGLKAYLKAGGREPGKGLFDDLLEIADQVPDPHIVLDLAQAKLDKWAAKQLKELKAKHPCVTGIVVAKVLTEKGKAPAEYQAYDVGYSEDIEGLIKKVTKAKGHLQLLATLGDYSSEPRVSTRKLFISKGVFAKVTKERSSGSTYVEPTPEEREAQRRERGINALANELVVRNLTLERLWQVANVRSWMDTIELTIRVSDESRDSFIQSATAEWEEREAERVKAEEAQALADEAESNALAEKHSAAIALLDELALMDKPPFHVELEAGNDIITVERLATGDVDFTHPETADVEVVEWGIAIDLLKDYLGGYIDAGLATTLSVIREDSPIPETDVPFAEHDTPDEQPGLDRQDAAAEVVAE